MSDIRIVSRKAELSVLRGMTSKNKAIAGTLFSGVDERFFHGEVAQECYHTILRSYVDTGESPNLRLILQDPDLSREAKQYLSRSENSIVTIRQADKAAKILNTYRQRRELVELSESIKHGLRSKKKTDILVDELASQFSRININKSIENAFLHYGKNNNSNAAVKDMLFGEDTDDVIPTGIEEFDKQSGGFVRTNLVTIGSNSGGGKSLMAGQLAINMSSFGYKVLLVPLEMSHKEMNARIIANIAGYDNTQILHRKLSSTDREIAYKKYAQWVKRTKRAGGRYTIFKPPGSMSLEEIVASTSAFHVDVVIIDYVSLLRLSGRKEQWQQLSDTSKFAKQHAEAMNRVSVLLAQINKDGDMRYAKALTEDSNASWTWLTPEQEKEKPVGTIVVKQPKSRSSKAYPMRLGVNWSNMRIVKAPSFAEDTPTSLQQKPRKALTNLA